MKRIHALDGLRGVLALVVVAHHVAMFCGSYALAPAGKYCVWAFFVMSGLVLSRSYDWNFGKFLIRRFLRLWPVYAVTMSAGCLVLGRFPTLPDLSWYPWINGAPEVAMTEPDPPAWSLCIEASAMLVMPLIAWFGVRPARVLLAPVVWLGLVGLDGRFFWLAFFLAGAALSHVDFRSVFLEAPPAQWLGKISYSLYLSHWPLLRLSVLLMGKPGLLLAIPLVFPFAWLVWRLVEQPSIRLSRRVIFPTFRRDAIRAPFVQ
jgi:peptidoglycan/LPS O-acetylase OafA/YrhL